MRRFTHLIAITLVLITILSTAALAEHPFRDVPNDAYYTSAVDYVYENGLLIGTSDYEFSPNDSLTRAMFVTVLGRFEGVDASRNTHTAFSDVDTGSWYTDYVAWAADESIVEGYGNGMFGTYDAVTNEQIAVMITRYLNSRDIQLPILPGIDIDGDDLNVSSWAKSDVLYLMQTGVMPYNTAGLMHKLREDATRADTAVIFMNLDLACANISNESSITEEAVYMDIIAMKEQYPEGMSLTDQNFYYAWNGGIYNGGTGCFGFACMLSDAAFGNLKARMYRDFDSIRVGDIIRMNYDTHSVIVLSIDQGIFTIAEGNYNSSVHWGRRLTLDQIKKSGTYVLTRYPE